MGHIVASREERLSSEAYKDLQRTTLSPETLNKLKEITLSNNEVQMKERRIREKEIDIKSAFLSQFFAIHQMLVILQMEGKEKE